MKFINTKLILSIALFVIANSLSAQEIIQPKSVVQDSVKSQGKKQKIDGIIAKSFCDS